MQPKKCEFHPKQSEFHPQVHHETTNPAPKNGNFTPESHEVQSEITNPPQIIRISSPNLPNFTPKRRIRPPKGAPGRLLRFNFIYFAPIHPERIFYLFFCSGVCPIPGKMWENLGGKNLPRRRGDILKI